MKNKVRFLSYSLGEYSLKEMPYLIEEYVFGQDKDEGFIVRKYSERKLVLDYLTKKYRKATYFDPVVGEVDQSYIVMQQTRAILFGSNCYLVNPSPNYRRLVALLKSKTELQFEVIPVEIDLFSIVHQLIKRNNGISISKVRASYFDQESRYISWSAESDNDLREDLLNMYSEYMPHLNSLTLHSEGIKFVVDATGVIRSDSLDTIWWFESEFRSCFLKRN